MTMRFTRLIPAGLFAAAALPLAVGQSAPSPVQDALKAIPDAVTAPAPEQAPPKPPKVTCSGDQLTISASNSSLESILVMVRGCSGAKIEIPESASRTRSYEELGPGPVRKVLDELLSGTDFNYVIQSSDANPQRVESVMLSVRTKDTGGKSAGGIDAPNTEIAMTPGRKKWLAMQKFDKPDPSSPDADPRNASDAAAAADTQPAPAQDAAKPADNTSAKPADTAAADTAAATPAPPPPADNSASGDPSKATEDKITSMQQMFDQRRQMIEKQSVPSAPAQPSSPN